jgi:benzoyl-CoA reductase/2-hydroxyglutaryl-CoA dehydratase subunit BcrC/BadD/HgdB
LDWTDRQEDNALGIVTNKFRRLKPKDVEVAFLKDRWLPDAQEHDLINSCAKSGMPWIAEQVKAERVDIIVPNLMHSERTWGFEEIGVEAGKKERRYVRRIHFEKDEIAGSHSVYYRESSIS